MRGLLSGNRPDLTPAQLVGAIPILGELLHAFGIYNLTGPQQDSLSKAATYALGLIGADALLRIGRNVKDGKVEAAAVSSSAEPHDVTLPAGSAVAAPLAPGEVAEVDAEDVPEPGEVLPEDVLAEDVPEGESEGGEGGGPGELSTGPTR